MHEKGVSLSLVVIVRVDWCQFYLLICVVTVEYMGLYEDSGNL